MRLTLATLAAALAAEALLSCSGGVADQQPTATPRSGVERAWCEELSIMAANRLRCAPQNLSCRRLEGRVHLIEGCGDRVRYLIFDRGGTWVKVESFHERAAFETACDIDELVVDRESAEIWRAIGCGRTARYRLACDEAGETCEWTRAADW